MAHLSNLKHLQVPIWLEKQESTLNLDLEGGHFSFTFKDVVPFKVAICQSSRRVYQYVSSAILCCCRDFNFRYGHGAAVTGSVEDLTFETAKAKVLWKGALEKLIPEIRSKKKVFPAFGTLSQL